MRRVLLWFVWGLLLTGLAWANDGSYREDPQSGLVFPVNNTAVRMVSEEVVYSREQFLTMFLFQNTTDREQEVTFGFPVAGEFKAEGDVSPEVYQEEAFYNILPPERRKDYLRQKIQDYFRFRSYVKGKEVERKLTESAKPETDGYRYVFLTRVKFQPRETLSVTNIYHQRPIASAHIYGYSENTIRYIFRTGALWNAPIQAANFTFYLEKQSYERNYLYLREHPAQGKSRLYQGAFMKRFCESKPAAAQIEEFDDYYLCRWHFQDIKPQEDIVLKWGCRDAVLDVKPLAQIPLFIQKKEINGLPKAFPEFFSEMKNRKIFYDFIIATAQCYAGRGFTSSAEINPSFLINSLYALRGYQFKSPEWLEFYKLFPWYAPVTANPLFTEEEQQLLKGLLKVGIPFP